MQRFLGFRSLILFVALHLTLFFSGEILTPPASAQIASSAPQILSGVGLDEKLGEQLPLDLPFLSHTGQRITLGDLAEIGKPILLNPLYYECPVLCNLVIDGVANSMEKLDWIPGDEFIIVSFTVDTGEGPAEAAKTRERILKQLGSAPNATPARMAMVEEGWFFLSDVPVDEPTQIDVSDISDSRNRVSTEISETAHIQNQGSAAVLADAIGFRFKPEPLTGEIIHPAVIMFLTNQEHSESEVSRELIPRDADESATISASHRTLSVARYLYGFNFDPFDLKNALFEAADGRIGRTVEQILLYCYTYDPNSRSYVPLAWNIMKLGGLVTALFLGIFLSVLWLRAKRA